MTSDKKSQIILFQTFINIYNFLDKNFRVIILDISICIHYGKLQKLKAYRIF